MAESSTITREMIKAAAAAIANNRAARGHGAPPISNVLDILPEKLLAEVMEDAEAALTAALAKGGLQTAAITDVLAERRRQVEAEGWTPEHDDTHGSGEMATAAACYAYVSPLNEHERRRIANEGAPYRWPWDPSWWKPADNRRDLVKAGALILADIERLDRAALATGGAR